MISTALSATSKTTLVVLHPMFFGVIDRSVGQHQLGQSPHLPL